MRKRNLVIAVVLLVVLAVYALPWKDLLKSKLEQELAKRDIHNLEFSIDSVSLNKINFKDIAYGELNLTSLSVDYELIELLKGNFQKINSDEIKIKSGKIEALLRGVDVNIISNDWQIKSINILGTPVILPPITGKGKIEFAENKLALSGDIFSTDKKTATEFKFDYSLNDDKSAILKIISTTLPWSEGVLSAQNISVPIFSDAPIAISLKVKQVSLNSLLSASTGDRATATGVVSGTLPVVINRDGTFTMKKGNLKTDEAGTLKLSPDVIPSDAQQVALVRDVLKNFHYSLFSMSIETADSKQLSMLLSLEGNNPDVYNGKTVKLNVHLTGDVIEMITQSLNLLK
ncbi:MAG: YdbH domain-containing protein [Pseudomonadota bacterium]